MWDLGAYGDVDHELYGAILCLVLFFVGGEVHYVSILSPLLHQLLRRALQGCFAVKFQK